MKSLIKITLGSALLIGCQTLDRPLDKDDAPQIHTDLPVKDALVAAVNHGGQTLKSVIRLFKRRGDWMKAYPVIEQAIKDGILQYGNTQLINVVLIYQASPVQTSPVVFDRLVSSGRLLARQLGWQLASTKPSPLMAKAIDVALSRALAEGDEKSVLIPEMAKAVHANRLVSAYSVMRQGLFMTNHESFASAMAALNPKAASSDFLDYLAQAPVDELRQLTLRSVNSFACMVILKHMTKYPPPVTHPKFGHLFLYTISRNRGLGDQASDLVRTYLPSNSHFLAFVLARLPGWVQMAYIENARRRLSSDVALFLKDLKEATPQKDVIEEIDQVRF